MAESISIAELNGRPYFLMPQPANAASPAMIGYGAQFSVQTATPAAISALVPMRARAVTHAFNRDQRLAGCAITGRTATAVKARVLRTAT